MKCEKNWNVKTSSTSGLRGLPTSGAKGPEGHLGSGPWLEEFHILAGAGGGEGDLEHPGRLGTSRKAAAASMAQ